MIADLAAPIRVALLADASITSLLPVYLGSRTVFTRRPAPTDAPYPMILVSPDISVSDADGINDLRPVAERDVSIYGENDTAAKYRDVETLARAVRTLFHRQRHALSVGGWSVSQIVVRGPRPAPVDDMQTVGRVVTLTISLSQV